MRWKMYDGRRKMYDGRRKMYANENDNDDSTGSPQENENKWGCELI